MTDDYLVYRMSNSNGKVIDYQKSLAKAEARIAELEQTLREVVLKPQST